MDEFCGNALVPGQTRSRAPRDEEVVLLWLGGRSTADWGAGRESVGGREDVFEVFLMPFICRMIIGSL